VSSRLGDILVKDSLISADQLKQALDYYREFLARSKGEFPDEEWKARQRAKLLDRELSKR